jgi:hypothetical protein
MDQEIEIGPMSGKANIIFWLERRGFKAADELVETIFARAKQADRLLTEAGLLRLCRQRARQGAKQRIGTRNPKKRASRRPATL